MSATAYATTFADVTRTLVAMKPAPVLADVFAFARKDWPTMSITASSLLRLTHADTLEFAKERAERELARDDNRRAAKHWSADLNRSIALRQFADMLDRFERQMAEAA